MKHTPDARLHASLPVRVLFSALIGFGRRLGNASPFFFQAFLRWFATPVLSIMARLTARGLISRSRAIGCPLPAVWLTLKGADADGAQGERGTGSPETVIVWLPGGGFITRSPTATPFAMALLPRLARLLPAGSSMPRILVLNYRLPAKAAETMYDLEAALSWASASGRRLIVCGDSAGGYLAVSLALRAARQRGAEGAAAVVWPSALLGAVGVCPWLDLTLSGGSVQQNLNMDLLPLSFVERGARCWVQAMVDSGIPEEEALRTSSPAIASDLSYMEKGKVFLVAGARDILRDDALRFAKRAPEGTVRTLVVDDGVLGTHDMVLMLRSEKTEAAFDAVAGFCAERMAA